PPAMENVLLKALAKDPNNRYTTAAEMVAAFKAAAAGGLPRPAIEPAALDPTQATTAFPAAVEAMPLAPLPDLLSEDTPSSDGPDNGVAGNNAVVADTVVAPVPAGPIATTAVSPARVATQPRQRPLFLILGGIVLGMLLCAGAVLGLSRLQRTRQAQTREATRQAVVAADTATAQAAMAAMATAAAVPTLPPTSLPGPAIPRPPLLPTLDRVRPVEVLEPLVAANPDNLALKSELALAYLQAGQNEQARELFEEVLQNVRNPLAIVVAAERLMELGRFDMATLFLENGLARFPEERTLQHLLLMSYIFSEQAPEVVLVFLDRLPEDAEGKMNRSIGAVYLAYRGGDLPQAQAILDEALAAPGSLYRSELYYLQGLLFLQSGDSEQARNAFQEALLNDPPTWLMPHIRERLAQLDG
ncbi:MAG: tetratricopeptide repeat protein, partial [Chloroflexi bacterium]|nr:tetratricopeptide repeat protein [Chloroflexota bacterium]